MEKAAALLQVANMIHVGYGVKKKKKLHIMMVMHVLRLQKSCFFFFWWETTILFLIGVHETHDVQLTHCKKKHNLS